MKSREEIRKKLKSAMWWSTSQYINAGGFMGLAIWSATLSMWVLMCLTAAGAFLAAVIGDRFQKEVVHYAAAHAIAALDE